MSQAAVHPTPIPSLPPTSPDHEFDATAVGGSLVNLGQENFPHARAAAVFLPEEFRGDLSLITRERQFQQLQDIKRILRHGTFEAYDRKILPFVFQIGDQKVIAEAAGLEGFVFSERLVRERFTQAESAKMLDHYLKYVLALLNGAPSTKPARDKLLEIQNSTDSAEVKYVNFSLFINSYVEDLREQVRRMDPAYWSHWARAYHLFIRAFNLEGWREAANLPATKPSGKIFSDFTAADVSYLTAHGFDCIRFMGTYPIGEQSRKGTAGGSPFSLRDFNVASEHGSTIDVRNFIRGSATVGMRTIFEVVLNHTSADSQLLEWNPRFFVHTQQKPEDETGYYHYKSDRHGEFWIRHGGYLDNEKRVYWDDTLQLDISNPDTRRMLGQITCEIVRCYGPHGLRFDAVENMVHEQWMRCWGEDGGQKRQLPKEELLAEIVHEVKARYPTVTCIAEAYKWWDKMSEMGFDLIYGLEDMSREVAVQHRGWQASLVSRDPSRIREALRRAEFLHWQEGGADMVTFWGHQDKEAPWRIFGENWKWGAAALTILKPGPLNFYASSEAVFESPDSDGDKKVLSFNHPVTIDWSGTAAPFGKFQRGLLAYYRKLERELGSQLHFHVLEPKDPAETWVGYVIREMNAGSDARKVIVVANPADTATKVSIHRPDLQIRDFSRELGPCGEKGVRIFEFKPGK